MKITVLGSSGPYPAKDDACTSYLVQSRNKSVVIDMGPGVMESLQHYIKPWQVDGIILSHLHYDHFSDIYSLRYSTNPGCPLTWHLLIILEGKVNMYKS